MATARRLSPPVMAGTLPARVTSTVKNDIYAHIDKDGRYRVNLDFDRDTWKPGYESLWVRQSRRMRRHLRPALAAAGGNGSEYRL